MRPTVRSWTRDQAAKDLDELFAEALREGPQSVRLPDGGELVVLSREDYGPGRPTLVEVLRSSAGLDGDDDALEDVVRSSRNRGDI